MLKLFLVRELYKSKYVNFCFELYYVVLVELKSIFENGFMIVWKRSYERFFLGKYSLCLFFGFWVLGYYVVSDGRVYFEIVYVGYMFSCIEFREFDIYFKKNKRLY